MLNLSPANKLILVNLALVAVAVLVVRLFLKWRRSRVTTTAPDRRGPVPVEPVASVTTPAAPQSPYVFDEPEPVPQKAAKSLTVAVAANPTPVVTASSMSRRGFDAQVGTVPLEFDEFPGTDDSDYRFGSATSILAAMLPESEDRRRAVTRTLQNAGEYNRHAWHNFAAVRYLGIVLPILFFGAGLVLVPEPLEPLMIAGIVVGPILGWAIPTILLQNRAQKRLGEIAQGIPDMLDILNMCVSQGMTVPAALGRVGQDLEPVYPALAKELNIVTAQARVGTLQQALASFSQRCDIPEVHSFTSLLTQTEKMGTSMSAALVEYSDNMRETVKQRSDEKANSATFKLLFPTVLCLMPAVFLLLLGPAIVELSNFFTRGGSDILNNGGRVAQESREI